MPAFESSSEGHGATAPAPGLSKEDQEVTAFPPVTREHVLNCSYDSWFPDYKSWCIQSRIISLPPHVVEYIHEDGIILADEDGAEDDDADVEWQSAAQALRPAQQQDEEESESEDESPIIPPNQRFPEFHQSLKDTIRELGGAVVPKLNWSAPRDATWISSHQNTMKCTEPNDIYILLKSSSFISHDLDHAFDDTVSTSNPPRLFNPVLVLRPFLNIHPALEFRCFVKQRTLAGVCQRDVNHNPSLRSLGSAIMSKIDSFFNNKIRYAFPDASFVFDVYIPEKRDDSGVVLDRLCLIDINPWAPRTDSLLFDWKELLEMKVSNAILGSAPSEEEAAAIALAKSESDTTDDEEEEFVPELRLVEKDDPMAVNFSAPAFSAHKLPKEVVEAGMGRGGGLCEFARQWKEMIESRENGGSQPNGSR
jgi:hypothetical protein